MRHIMGKGLQVSTVSTGFRKNSYVPPEELFSSAISVSDIPPVWSPCIDANEISGDPNYLNLSIAAWVLIAHFCKYNSCFSA